MDAQERKDGLAARLCLVVASVLLVALLCEAALRLFLPKYRDVAEGRLQADDLRIFAPVPNSRGWRVHPDTRQPHPVHFNNLGLRQHREFSDADLVSATTVGVFGDSFVQMSYLEAPHVFTEPLDYLLNLDADFTVLNFGVHAYGPAQSYFTYRSFRARDDLDYVLFVYFGGNDLSDLVQNRLFDLDDDGLLRQREVRGSAWWVPFASRLHLTYLALDATGRLAPYIDAAIAELRGDWYAVKTLGVERLRTSAALFGQLIARWRMEVEESGGTFLVVLLPTQPDFPLVRPLLEDAGIGVVDLNACYESRGEGYWGSARGAPSRSPAEGSLLARGAPSRSPAEGSLLARGAPSRSPAEGSWRESPHRLKNGSHWNEHANRLAAACLDDRLRREAGLPGMTEAARDAALDAYYAAFEPSAGVAGEEIRRKYQALGGFEFDSADANIESRLSADKLVVSNEFDVYLDGSQLVFVKDDCDAKSTTLRLFAHATPLDASVLPPYKSYLAPLPVYDEGRCLAQWDLSAPVSHILVGQRNNLGEVLWSDEVVIDQAAFEGTLAAMLAAAGEPVIESDMDVHVHGQRIFYVSDDCERTESPQRGSARGEPLASNGRTPFALHVTPAREADLQPDRIEHGFNNEDFIQPGVTLGERCVVRWWLPDYPIRRIRTGQYAKVRDGENVHYTKFWEGEAEIGG